MTVLSTSLPTPARRSRVLRVAGWLLLVLGALRLGYVVGHTPLAGYANQYDMLRAHACLGLWPDRPAELQATAHPQAPIDRYVRGAPDPRNCHASTDVWLGKAGFALATLVADTDGRLPLRAVGMLKALLLLALAVTLQWSLRRHAAAALLHACAFTVILCDPLNTLYLNSLYTEFGALLGSYALLGGLLLAGQQGAEGRSSRLSAVLLVLGTLALACSRLQHLPIAVLLAVAGFLAWRAPTRARMLFAALLLAALAVGTLNQLDAQRRLTAVPLANRADALFGALLPASADPPALLARLDLPVHCDELRFANWYTPRGRDLFAHCPEALRPGLSRIGLALLAEPLTGAVALARGITSMGPWRLNYLGELAGQTNQRLPAGALGLGASIGDLAAPRGVSFQLLFWWGALLLASAPVATAVRRWRGRGDNPDHLGRLLPALAAIIALGWAASVFGDGYSELARHLHLAINAALLAWLLGLCWLLRCIRRRQVVLPLGVLILWLGLTALTLQLPLAIGRLTTPAVDAIDAGVQPVSGWVVADGQPQQVEVCVQDDACLTATLAPDPAVGWYFALDHASAAWSFRAERLLAPGQTLEVWLTDQRGHRQLVERRVFIAR